jgi:hypothetical protein
MYEQPARLCGDAKICEYLLERHGLKLSPKTTRNLRAAGKGPEVHYFGARVYSTPAKIDQWVAERITNETWSRRATAGDERPEAA